MGLEFQPVSVGTKFTSITPTGTQITVEQEPQLAVIPKNALAVSQTGYNVVGVADLNSAPVVGSASASVLAGVGQQQTLGQQVDALVQELQAKNQTDELTKLVAELKAGTSNGSSGDEGLNKDIVAKLIAALKGEGGSDSDNLIAKLKDLLDGNKKVADDKPAGDSEQTADAKPEKKKKDTMAKVADGVKTAGKVAKFASGVMSMFG
ncbi:MAG: hypothetical protein KTR14_02700 [Vampirovibrio sp.]|nr:hypothetical protein [Vampirovibrio sp.]